MEVLKLLRSFGGENLKKRHRMSNLGSYERILKLILRTHDGWQWNGSIWLRTETKWRAQVNAAIKKYLVFYKMWRIS